MNAILRAAAVKLLLLAALPAAAQGLAVDIARPAEGVRVDTPMPVAVLVSGPYEVKGVRAAIGDRTIDLAFSSGAVCNKTFCTPGWVGNFDLMPFARGPLTMTVTATDAVGATASSTRSFIYDRVPVITLTAPAGPAVATPFLPLQATCTDDDPGGCSRFEAILQGVSSGMSVVVASGRDILDTVVDLTPYDGRELTMVVIAYDAANQVSSVSRQVFVDASVHLQRVAEVPGEVLDVDTTRVLYRHAVTGAIVIRQRGTGADTVIYDRVVPAPHKARLTAAGAALTAYTPTPTVVTGMFSWESGTLVELGPVNSTALLEAEGPFVLWTNAGHAYRRNVVAGTTVELGIDVSNIDQGLAPDGAVAWWDTSYDVTLARADGTVVPVATGGAKWNVYPRTDGQSVVYRRQDPCCGATNPSVMLYRNGTTTELAQGGEAYRIRSGWVVYDKPSPANVRQLWRLGPAGEEPSQLTFFSTGSYPEHVTAGGRVQFRTGTRRFIAYEDTILDVAAAAPHAVTYQSEGRFFQSLFGAVFEIVRAPVAAAPRSVVFPLQPVSASSVPRPVSITNTGASALTGMVVAVEGPFTLSHDCGGSMGPGLSCTAMVVFDPTTTGVSTGSLRIAYTGGEFVVPLSGTAEQSLVTHYYRTILGREPDTAGKLFWEQEAARMANLGADRTEAWYAMAMGFFFGVEYLSRATNPTQFVTDLYRAFFSREPDAPGLDYWTGLMASGMPREVVLAGFMFSPEFALFTREIFGDTAARAEANLTVDFYRGLLARLPDDAGFMYWVGRFRDAQCSGSAAVEAQAEAMSTGFAGSAEYANRARGNAQFVGDLYNAVLRRGGDLAGVQFWVDQLEQGATRDFVRRAFVSSREFGQRVQQVVQQGCLP